jgi:hypothetical protein
MGLTSSDGVTVDCKLPARHDTDQPFSRHVITTPDRPYVRRRAARALRSRIDMHVLECGQRRLRLPFTFLVRSEGTERFSATEGQLCLQDASRRSASSMRVSRWQARTRTSRPSPSQHGWGRADRGDCRSPFSSRTLLRDPARTLADGSSPGHARRRSQASPNSLSRCETRASCRYARIEVRSREAGSRNEESWSGRTGHRRNCLG